MMFQTKPEDFEAPGVHDLITSLLNIPAVFQQSSKDQRAEGLSMLSSAMDSGAT